MTAMHNYSIKNAKPAYGNASFWNLGYKDLNTGRFDVTELPDVGFDGGGGFRPVKTLSELKTQYNRTILVPEEVWDNEKPDIDPESGMELCP
jgi:hypothetical protein